MRRREFSSLLVGAAAAWPTAAQSQQTYKLGVLSGRGRQQPNFCPFHELRQFGVVEGQQLAVDQRGFEAREDRFPSLAKELVSSRVDAILAAGDIAVRAAQNATRTIPILAISDDMVEAGLVRSLARPGSNITGVSILSSELKPSG
jgi:putative ABC transport system substrate-binding protein